jgi:hypothetical protein
MTPSDRDRAAGWRALLAEPGPQAVNDRVLRLVRNQAAGPLTGPVETVIAGADEALAGLAALRGSAECREFLAAIEPVLASLRRRLQASAQGVNERSMLGLLSLAAIGETVGAPVDLPSRDVDRTFSRFLGSKIFSRSEKVVVALLSLGLDRADDVRLLFGKAAAPKPAAAGGDPVVLAKVLAGAMNSRAGDRDVDAAWEAFLRGFPAARQAEKTEWRHLLLAARVVLGKLGGTPMGEVAETLHSRIAALAAGEST